MRKNNTLIILIFLIIILALVTNIQSLKNRLLELELKEIETLIMLQEYERLMKSYEELLELREDLYNKKTDLDEQRLKTELEYEWFEMEATAYTDDVESQGKWVGQTASGMKPQVGVVAVDPKVIPLGTKLYVEGYGEAIAGDTGGAIKGNRIDLFMPTRSEASRFGRRVVRVRVVE